MSLAYALVLCLSLGAFETAGGCEDGTIAACTQSDGKPGVKGCIQGKWSNCGVAGGGAGSPSGSNFWQPANCPSERSVTYIRKGINDTPKDLRDAVKQANSLVLIAPDVEIDFTDVEKSQDTDQALVPFAACVTLASFEPSRARPTAPDSFRSARTPRNPGPIVRYGTCNPTSNPRDHRCTRSDSVPLFGITCISPSSTAGVLTSAEGARIAGFQLLGPNPADHFTGEVGIAIEGCHDVDISNMEIAGWGGYAIQVSDELHFGTHTIPDAKQAPADILLKIHDNYIHHNQHSSNHGALGYGVGVGQGAFADIYQNVFDYNRHAITASWSAGGYHAVHNLFLKGGGYHNGTFWGISYERDIHIVDVHGSDNCLFDSVPMDLFGDDTLGSAIVGTLVGAIVGALLAFSLGLAVGTLGPLGFWLFVAFLSAAGLGSGIWAAGPHNQYNCGAAGFSFLIDQNAFQYKKTNDIKIRGTPTGTGSNKTRISFNVFARGNQDDAIGLQNADAVDVRLNMYNTDTFGQYGVCDIDGDGVDDLVLMTGVNWWFSSGGVHPWTFLRRDIRVLQGTNQGNFKLAGDVRLGDFDGDGVCDALHDGGGGAWFISRGAVADWQPFGTYLAALQDVQFGRFDPRRRDFRPGIRRPLTHVFWRGDNGLWLVTPLGQPGLWQLVGSSSFPMSELRFGDFTGDSVTDVLATENGHWAISEGAQQQWRPLNLIMGTKDTVNGSNIFIANMDGGDNIDDVLRLDFKLQPGYSNVVQLTWNRSQNGVAGWSVLKSYAPMMYPSNNPDYVTPGFAFVGYFGAEPFGTTMIIDQNRIGHFFSPAQGPARPAEWTSPFAY